MQKDKRYAPANEVPAEVLAAMGSSEVFSPGFSIKGQALEGRASYLVREQNIVWRFCVAGMGGGGVDTPDLSYTYNE